MALTMDYLHSKDYFFKSHRHLIFCSKEQLTFKTLEIFGYMDQKWKCFELKKQQSQSHTILKQTFEMINNKFLMFQSFHDFIQYISEQQNYQMVFEQSILRIISILKGKNYEKVKYYDIQLNKQQIGKNQFLEIQNKILENQNQILKQKLQNSSYISNPQINNRQKHIMKQEESSQQDDNQIQKQQLKQIKTYFYNKQKKQKRLGKQKQQNKREENIKIKNQLNKKKIVKSKKRSSFRIWKLMRDQQNKKRSHLINIKKHNSPINKIDKRKRMQKQSKFIIKCVNIGNKYKIEYQNGDQYFGEIQNKIYNGQGIYQSHCGWIYEGKWANGKANGYGIYTQKDGNVYKGNFLNDQRSGNGVQQYKNGQKYIGNHKNGVKSGYGEYHFQDGTIFKGEWKYDKMHGKGIQTFNGEISFRGIWKNDKKDGNYFKTKKL